MYGEETAVRMLLVATHNKGKVAELAEILAGKEGGLGLDGTWAGKEGGSRTAPTGVLTLGEAGITWDVEETGVTFRENAELKAVTYAAASGLLTLADDSGLEVDALGGEPGVYTARFGGEGLSSAERYELLLEKLAGVVWAERTARFRCVVALADENGLIGTAEGVCEGMIALEPAGTGGFGYDPVFYLPERGVTMAQLTAEEKHGISHRGRAVGAIRGLLRERMKDEG